MSINEVMSAGRAVIVTNEVGCHSDLVRDGVNGSVVPVRDPEALAAALRHILSSERVWQAMGRESLRMIAHHGFEENVAGLRQALAAVSPGFRAQAGN